MKETVNKINRIEESFNNLDLGNIAPGSDGYMAVRDSLRLENKKKVIIRTMASGVVSSGFDLDFSYSGINFKLDEFKGVDDEKKDLIEKNVDNVEYLNIFNKLDGWLNERTGSDCSTGSKLKFLKSKFGIDNEETKQGRVDLDRKDEVDCFGKDSEKIVITFRDLFKRNKK